jgi:hypothetical protein
VRVFDVPGSPSRCPYGRRRYRIPSHPKNQSYTPVFPLILPCPANYNLRQLSAPSQLASNQQQASRTEGTLRNRWNHIDPTCTFTAFLVSVLVGARRFAHASLLRGDRALHVLLGLNRFPTDDTIRNLFRAFGMGQVQRLYEPLAEWQMQRLPRRDEGYTLDLDSTVLERYGKQEGSLKGHNPRKHGRPSHHPLLAVLSEAHFLLHGWLRSGNCGTSRGVEEFLKEALALFGQREKIRLLKPTRASLTTSC